jgi:hypothetical protein
MLLRVIVFVTIIIFPFTPQGKEFLAIWSHWFVAEDPISQVNLWGHKVYWWGRFGKLLEMVGALFILCDIFGYEKTINFFQKYKIGPKELFNAISDAWKEAYKNTDNMWETLLKRSSWSTAKQHITDQITNSQKHELFQACFNMIGVLGFVTVGTILVHNWLLNFGQGTSTHFNSLDNFLIFVAWVISFFVFYFCLFIAMFVGSLVIQFIASAAQTEQGLRLINLVIVLIGFMFDILAT